MKIVVFLCLFFVYGFSLTNYTSSYLGNNPSSYIVFEGSLGFPPVVIKYAGFFTNYIAEDVVEDALNQYGDGDGSTLGVAKKSVIDAIEFLLPELKKLEEQYRKLNIVTKRLDTIRKLNTLTEFSNTHKLKKSTLIDRERLKLIFLKNNSDIDSVEKMLIDAAISKEKLWE